ncbi:MAG: hypothetical protein PHY59_08605, partial [Methanobacterium sp.]|nr:hypothetical protein [Methanobacterium sp.]
RNFKNFPLSTGGSFKNQWIKFNYPPNLTVTDSSTDNQIQISLYNETMLVGDITVSEGKISEEVMYHRIKILSVLLIMLPHIQISQIISTN